MGTLEAGVTYLRKLADLDEIPSSLGGGPGRAEQWGTGHIPECPKGEHKHVVWYPLVIHKGTISGATQAGFSLAGFEKMARMWETQWCVTLPYAQKEPS